MKTVIEWHHLNGPQVQAETINEFICLSCSQPTKPVRFYGHSPSVDNSGSLRHISITLDVDVYDMKLINIVSSDISATKLIFLSVHH